MPSQQSGSTRRPPIKQSPPLCDAAEYLIDGMDILNWTVGDSLVGVVGSLVEIVTKNGVSDSGGKDPRRPRNSHDRAKKSHPGSGSQTRGEASAQEASQQTREPPRRRTRVHRQTDPNRSREDYRNPRNSSTNTNASQRIDSAQSRPSVNRSHQPASTRRTPTPAPSSRRERRSRTRIPDPRDTERGPQSRRVSFAAVEDPEHDSSATLVNESPDQLSSSDEYSDVGGSSTFEDDTQEITDTQMGSKIYHYGPLSRSLGTREDEQGVEIHRDWDNPSSAEP